MGVLAHWGSRVGSLLFAAFIALFALDVFGTYQGLELAFALAMHLIPAGLVLAVAALGWRWPVLGAIGFLVLAGAYVTSVGFERPLSWYGAICGPALLLSALFFFDAAVTKHDR
jgi:hypothetical protein